MSRVSSEATRPTRSDLALPAAREILHGIAPPVMLGYGPGDETSGGWGATLVTLKPADS